MGENAGYQQKLLERQGYSLHMEDGDSLLYSRETVSHGFTVTSLVEIFTNENPDNIFYRGLVTIRKNEEVIGEWDSEKKYRILDVLGQVNQLHGLMDRVLENYS